MKVIMEDEKFYVVHKCENGRHIKLSVGLDSVKEAHAFINRMIEVYK